MRWGLGVDFVEFWTGLGAGDKFHWGRGINICTVAGVALFMIIYIIGSPRGHFPLTDFVGLSLAEARFIKIEIFLRSDQLL